MPRVQLLTDWTDSRIPLAGLLLAAAVLLRVVLALHPGLWVDEVFSLAMATGHSLEHPAADANPALGDYVEPHDPQLPSTFRRYMEQDFVPAGPARVIRAVWLSDTSPPLYYLLLNLWTRGLGTSDAALRLFSGVWAIACFPVLWVLARRLGGQGAAWASWVLFAFSPPALYYSAEGRMYAMVWFLSLLLTWSTLALSQRGPRTSVIVLWILSSAAGLLTHYYFVFELVVSVAWLFCHSSGLSRSQLAFLIACAGATVLPWYLHVPESLGRWRVTQSWLSHPLTAADMFANPVRLAWSYVSVTGLWGGSRRGNIVALAVYGGLAALIVRERAGKVSSGDRRFLWFLVLASVLGPVVFDVLRHTNSSSIARYALPGLPAALLLIAIGTSVLPTKIQAAALIALTIVWLPGLRHVFAEPSRPFEPFPLAASQVAANVDDSQVVIVHSIPSGVIAVARYLAPAAPMVSWVVQLRQRDTDDDMERLTSGYRNVALIKIHDLGESSPAEDWLLHNATHKSTFALAAFPKSEIRDFEMRSE